MIALAIIMVIVGILMLMNRGTDDNRLFWETFGIIVIMLAVGLLVQGVG